MTKVKLSTGVTVEVAQLSNVSLYNEFDSSDIVEPKPPQYEQYGVIHDNLMHPLWHDAVAIYNAQRVTKAFLMVLERAVTVSDAEIQHSPWPKLKPKLRRFTKFEDLGERLNFLHHYAIRTLDDKGKLANAALLTEQRVYHTFSSIPFTRNGADIHEAALKNAIDTGIQAYPFIIGNQQLVNPMDEFNACKEALMSWEGWLKGEYTQDVKATTVAMYRLERLVNTHQDDAVQIESERRSKSKGNR